MRRYIQTLIILPAVTALSACVGTAADNELAVPAEVEALPVVEQTAAPQIVAATKRPSFTQAEIEAMTQEEKVAVYNIGRAAADQIYCERRVRTGSHRKSRQCFTGAERELDREAARRFFRSAR